MTIRRLGPILLALVALLAFSSTAMAKNGVKGGGGGDAKCFQFTNFSAVPGSDSAGAFVQLDYTIVQSCFDERLSGGVGETITNQLTGFTTRSVIFQPLGTYTISKRLGLAFDTPYTITVDVSNNGKLQDIRTADVLVPTPAS